MSSRATLGLLGLLSGAHAGVCNDKRPDCANWAKEKQCQTNAEFMQTTCPLSCGVCTFDCEDTHESCTAWAQEGECEKNPAHSASAHFELRPSH